MSSSAALSSAPEGRPVTGRVLAIDYGRSRLGLALSDPVRATVRPLTTWKRSRLRRDLARLRDLCREQEVSLIVVGLPLHLDGTKGEMAVEAERFAEQIRAGLRKPVQLMDERLSSWKAEQAIREGDAKTRSGQRKQRKLDELAAAVILTDYLQAGRTA